MSAVAVHLLRHGKIDSHRGDIALAPDAGIDIDRASARIIQLLRPNERLSFRATGTKRSKQTAMRIRGAIAMLFGETADLEDVQSEWGIRNPDLFVAGYRVEMVSTPAAMVGQLPPGAATEADLAAIPFLAGFFGSSDRIGYWLNYPDPPGEDAPAVAQRILRYCQRLRDEHADAERRLICVTHSPVMRAVVTQVFGTPDPGEPDWAESIDFIIGETEMSVAFRDLKTTITN